MCIRDRNIKDEELSGRWDWAGLRKEVLANGVRNSLLVAPMPTASTSQILGNNEAFEPYTSNTVSYTHLDVYKRQDHRLDVSHF